jgi:hypothetical protein
VKTRSVSRFRDPPPITSVERSSGSTSSYVDVIDRVLDKGIVLDARIRVFVGGIDLVTVDARVIIASIDTYLGHWPALDGAATLSPASIV